MLTTDSKTLVSLARDAASRAYVPYSKFPVGAALVTKDGVVYQGCNIENASFGLTNCAERTAFFKAVSEGKKEFSALYIFGETDAPISPCGACRQVMAEFCEQDMPVYLISKTDELMKSSVKELLPYGFKNSDMANVK